MTMKQISRILDAINDGADTSPEIAEMLDLPIRIVSAQMSNMTKMGIIKKTGRYRHDCCPTCNRKWRKAFCYEAVN